MTAVKPTDFKGLSKRELRRRLANASNRFIEDTSFSEEMAKRLDLIQFLIDPDIIVDFEDYGDTREIHVIKKLTS